MRREWEQNVCTGSGIYGRKMIRKTSSPPAAPPENNSLPWGMAPRSPNRDGDKALLGILIGRGFSGV